MGYLLGGLCGLIIGAITIVTGAMEGRLSLKFVDGWVLPYSALWGVVIGGFGGVLYAFGQQGSTATARPGAVQPQTGLLRWGYELGTGGLAAGLTTIVIAGGGHLALMSIPDHLFDPNSDLLVDEVKP